MLSTGSKILVGAAALASQAHAASSNQMDQAIFEEIDASFLGSAIPTPYTHEGAITGMASGPLVGGDILPDLFACGVKENPDAPEAPPPSDNFPGFFAQYRTPVLLQTHTCSVKGTTFEDVTAGSGLEDVICNTVGAADFNGDGHIDLMTGNDAPFGFNQCNIALNNGDGTFEVMPMPEDQCPEYVSGIAIADVNNDSILDVFITTFGAAVEAGHPLSMIQPDHRLLLGNGDGTFIRATGPGTELLEAHPFPCTALFTDVDDDGWIDLMVGSCRFIPGPLTIFRNQMGGPEPEQWADVTNGKVQLDPQQRLMGAGGQPYGFWMGLSTGDLNNDGSLDFFVGNTGDIFRNGTQIAPRQATNNMILMKDPEQGTYVESYTELLADAQLPIVPWTWAASLQDFENSNGPDGINTVGAFPLSSNNEGLIYERPSDEAPYDLLSADTFNIGFAQSMVAADWSMDGRIDYAFIDRDLTIPQAVRVFENTVENCHSFLKVKLVSRGNSINTQAIGAKVVMYGPYGGPKARQVTAGTNNRSTEDATVNFGLGQFNAAEDEVVLSVQWPGSYGETVRYVLNPRSGPGRRSHVAPGCGNPNNKVVTISYEEGLISCRRPKVGFGGFELEEAEEEEEYMRSS